jgi:hypothetical protein
MSFWCYKKDEFPLRKIFRRKKILQNVIGRHKFSVGKKFWSWIFWTFNNDIFGNYFLSVENFHEWKWALIISFRCADVTLLYTMTNCTSYFSKFAAGGGESKVQCWLHHIYYSFEILLIQLFQLRLHVHNMSCIIRCMNLLQFKKVTTEVYSWEDFYTKPIWRGRLLAAWKADVVYVQNVKIIGLLL